MPIGSVICSCNIVTPFHRMEKAHLLPGINIRVMNDTSIVLFWYHNTLTDPVTTQVVSAMLKSMSVFTERKGLGSYLTAFHSLIQHIFRFNKAESTASFHFLVFTAFSLP